MPRCLGIAFILTVFVQLFLKSFFFCTWSYRIQIILNRSIGHTEGTLTGAATPGLSGPDINSNERVLYTPWSIRTGTSPLDAV